ncbi:MAG: Mut7-C RNAse domain-containing protein [Thermoplasmata archaeon]
MTDEPRWIVDEMLGRLARYLRFLGYDTEYATGRADEEISAIAHAQGRTLLTRDRLLGRQVPGAIALASDRLGPQLLELRRALPHLRTTVSFERCTRCNGRLSPVDPAGPTVGVELGFVPPSPVYQCERCAHLYWEGSHTAGIRNFLRTTFSA